MMESEDESPHSSGLKNVLDLCVQTVMLGKCIEHCMPIYIFTFSVRFPAFYLDQVPRTSSFPKEQSTRLCKPKINFKLSEFLVSQPHKMLWFQYFHACSRSSCIPTFSV